MNRRGFLGSILALAAAPAIVRADSLMRIVPTDVSVLTLDDITREAIRVLHDKREFLWNVSATDVTVSLEEFSRRVMQPAMGVLIQKVDTEMLTIRTPNPYRRQR